MRAWVVWPLVMVLGSLAPSVAASEPAVIVQDPRGDTALRGVTVPAAEAYDLVQIALEDETLESIVMRLEVVRMNGQAPPGEVGAHFRVGSSWWIAGWTTVPFASPPFVHRGGFYCPTDKDRHVDPARCDAFAASVNGNAYLVTLRREVLGALNQSVNVDELRGYADVVNDEDAPVRLDETARGALYVFATGRSVVAKGEAANATQAAASSDAPPAFSPLARGGDAGAATLPLGFAALVACVLVRAWRGRGGIS